MSLPTIQEESWADMAEQKSPNASPRPVPVPVSLSSEVEEFFPSVQPKPFKLNAEEFVPFNQRAPIPRRITRNNNANANLENARLKIQHQMRLANRTRNESKNIENLSNKLKSIAISNTRGNYNEKMQRYLNARATAVPLENIERNLMRPRNTRKSRKARKNRKTRKSRKNGKGRK
jgi:hypothetical protein